MSQMSSSDILVFDAKTALKYEHFNLDAYQTLSRRSIINFDCEIFRDRGVFLSEAES